jgi:SHS2 domain-containing protein
VKTVADLPKGPTAEVEADARLIAAAPELLEALEEAADALADEQSVIDEEERNEHPVLAGHFETLQKARAAIAKAKGTDP